MKIDKRTIDNICRMSDDKLWGAVRLFASSSGVNLSPRCPSPGEMQKLRRTLSSLTDSDISRATEILKTYKGK
ncbi:MAG: hypothetical protein E7660_05170 [Ruminococcaceae bacterium]|nr:hypothetical protein [Oscillospiraceae bacterium]